MGNVLFVPGRLSAGHLKKTKNVLSQIIFLKKDSYLPGNPWGAGSRIVSDPPRW